MIIKAIKIEPDIAVKIFEEHDVVQEEVYDMLNDGKPKFKRVGGNQYAAIGLSRSRYITIFFRYDGQTKEAEIATAYPSDEGQLKWYKKK